MFSRVDLAGARILITGASSGIGHALARELGRHRARLTLASRQREPLEELAALVRGQGGEARVVPADVTEAGQRAALVEEARAAYGGLDILVNNAGVGAMGFFDESGADKLRRIFEVNFFATAELTRLALADLRRGTHPMVVNVASVLGRRAVPGCVEYCASKFAVVGWSEGLRAELAGQGIHVLTACPGRIETAFRENLLEDRLRFPYYKKKRMSAERCAEIIAQAMRRRQNEVVITTQARALVWANRLVPRLLDAVLVRYARKAEAHQ